MAEFIKLTDEKVAEIAYKFGISADEVLQQWEAVQERGPEGALADMDQEVAGLEETINVVVEDVASRWLHAPAEDRARNIVEFYQEGWDSVTGEQVSEADVSDMFLKLSVALYLLAEARTEIARLSDGNYRVGGGT